MEDYEADFVASNVIILMGDQISFLTKISKFIILILILIFRAA